MLTQAAHLLNTSIDKHIYWYWSGVFPLDPRPVCQISTKRSPPNEKLSSNAYFPQCLSIFVNSVLFARRDSQDNDMAVDHGDMPLAYAQVVSSLNRLSISRPQFLDGRFPLWKMKEMSRETYSPAPAICQFGFSGPSSVEVRRTAFPSSSWKPRIC